MSNEVLLPSTYLLYLTLSVVMTVWVARTLFRHGRAFLVDAFRGNDSLADSVNHLLVVGFYLVNLGFITLFLRSRVELESIAETVELLSAKIGAVLIVLGVMHFVNLAGISKMRLNGDKLEKERAAAAQGLR